MTFREELALLSGAPGSAAHFSSMEPWLDLTLKLDRSGHITVQGTACDGPGIGNSLEFTLPPLDQSCLPEMLDQLWEIERELPLRGKPED